MSTATTVTTRREDRAALFDKLQDPATQPEFFEHVADDADWTVEGTHPLAIAEGDGTAGRARHGQLDGDQDCGRRHDQRRPGEVGNERPAGRRRQVAA